MDKIVQPAGSAKIAIAELQGRKKQVVDGAAADTAIPLPGIMATAFLFSVIGIDTQAVALADSVMDHTAASTIQAITHAVEGVTLTGTDPVSVTVTGHGLSTGDHITFDETVVGTTELNGQAFLVDVVDADTFTLRGTNAANFTAYTSGGNITTKYGELICTADTSSCRVIVETFDSPHV